MKNLTVTQRASRLFKSSEYQLLNNSNDSKILCAVNSISDEFYLLLKNKLFKIPSDPEEDIVPFDVPGNLKLVDLEYCSITQELYAACVSGDIMRMTTVGPEFECDVVTELDHKFAVHETEPRSRDNSSDYGERHCNYHGIHFPCNRGGNYHSNRFAEASLIILRKRESNV